ncbi:MAG: hypothetical protein AAFQ54_05600 [Pseudomonadota bacterium]
MTRTVLVDFDDRETMKLEELSKTTGGRDEDVLRAALDQLYAHHFERQKLKPRAERQKAHCATREIER